MCCKTTPGKGSRQVEDKYESVLYLEPKEDSKEDVSPARKQEFNKTLSNDMGRNSQENALKIINNDENIIDLNSSQSKKKKENRHHTNNSPESVLKRKFSEMQEDGHPGMINPQYDK